MARAGRGCELVDRYTEAPGEACQHGAVLRVEPSQVSWPRTSAGFLASGGSMSVVRYRPARQTTGGSDRSIFVISKDQGGYLGAHTSARKPRNDSSRIATWYWGISCTEVCGYPGYSEVSFACGIIPVLGCPYGSYWVTNH